MGNPGISCRGRKDEQGNSYGQLDVDTKHGSAIIKFTWRFHTKAQAQACEKWVKQHKDELQPIIEKKLFFGSEARLDHTWHKQLTDAYEGYGFPAPSPEHTGPMPPAEPAEVAHANIAAVPEAAPQAAVAVAAVPAAPAAVSTSQQLQGTQLAEVPPAKRQRVTGDTLNEDHNPSDNHNGCSSSSSGWVLNPPLAHPGQQLSSSPMGLAQHLQGQLQRNSALLLQPPVSQRQPAVIPQQPTSMQSSMAAAGREQVEGNVWSEDQLRQQRLLGMGSYGKVYAATITSDPLLQVAVKYWKTGRPLPPQESVLKHVKWLMGKACPALVPYLGARAKADGGLVLYMQLHTGKTLARFRQDCMDACTEPVLLSGFSTKGKNGIAYGSFHCKPGALPWDLKQQLARVLMQAMAQLQAAQLVHRDIKPLNIMLQGQEGAGGYEVQSAQFIDLELVAEAREDATTLNLGEFNLTQYIAPEVATPPAAAAAGMAPAAEAGAAAGNSNPQQQDQQKQLQKQQVSLRNTAAGQYLGSTSLTHKADIFSAGMIIFEIFTDAMTSTDMGVKKAIVGTADNFEEFLEFSDNLPQLAKGLLRCCLAREPEARLPADALQQHDFFRATAAELESQAGAHPGERRAAGGLALQWGKV